MWLIFWTLELLAVGSIVVKASFSSTTTATTLSSSSITSISSLLEMYLKSDNSTLLLNEICPCLNLSNSSSVEEKNADKMRKDLKLKTGWLNKIHHRATHSANAFWASLTVSALLISLTLGVLWSKMWKENYYLNIRSGQPVKYEQFNPKLEISVKEMLKSRSKSLATFFKYRRKWKNGEISEDETDSSFNAARDQVDSITYRRLIGATIDRDSSDESSSGNDYKSSPIYLSSAFSSDDEEDDVDSVYSMDQRTGEWIGSGKVRNRRFENNRTGVLYFGVELIDRCRRLRRKRNLLKKRNLKKKTMVVRKSGLTDELHLLSTSSDSDKDEHFRIG